MSTARISLSSPICVLLYKGLTGCPLASLRLVITHVFSSVVAFVFSWDFCWGHMGCSWCCPAFASCRRTMSGLVVVAWRCSVGGRSFLLIQLHVWRFHSSKWQSHSCRAWSPSWPPLLIHLCVSSFYWSSLCCTHWASGAWWNTPSGAVLRIQSWAEYSVHPWISRALFCWCCLRVLDGRSLTDGNAVCFCLIYL